MWNIFFRIDSCYYLLWVLVKILKLNLIIFHIDIINYFFLSWCNIFLYKTILVYNHVQKKKYFVYKKYNSR
jgi:hypothetical protein